MTAYTSDGVWSGAYETHGLGLPGRAPTGLGRLRRHSREYARDGAESAYEPVLPEPEVHRAIASLSDHHREVVVLRLLDWSEGDIAAALEVPAGTVKSRLNRALSGWEELEP